MCVCMCFYEIKSFSLAFNDIHAHGCKGGVWQPVVCTSVGLCTRLCVCLLCPSHHAVLLPRFVYSGGLRAVK